MRSQRITPACAGKSLSVSVVVHSVKDHPRVCGEKSPVLIGRGSLRGSPPRVRGKVPPRDGFGLILRITPACAGKRRLLQKGGITNEDHPRVCGEKRLAVYLL